LKPVIGYLEKNFVTEIKYLEENGDLRLPGSKTLMSGTTFIEVSKNFTLASKGFIVKKEDTKL
jgi:hypothetical protein